MHVYVVYGLKGVMHSCSCLEYQSDFCILIEHKNMSVFYSGH